MVQLPAGSWHYRVMDVAREHISHVLELTEILLSIQTGFSLVSAAVVCAMLESISGYGMEISAEKTKLMTNNTSGINSEIKVNGQKLETVTSFKYLGSVITDEGSKLEDSTDNRSIDKAETSLD